MSELLDRVFGRNDRVRGYATALVAVADAEGVLDRVADELFAFANAVEQDPKLRDAITDKALPLENRRALIRDILGGRAHDVTVTEVSFVVEAGRARDLGKISEGVVTLAAERHEQAVA